MSDHRLRGTLGVLLLAALPGSAAAQPRPDSRAVAPDIILHHGRVITVDSADRVAEAVAIRGDRIIAVGTNAAVRPMAGAKTRPPASSSAAGGTRESSPSGA